MGGGEDGKRSQRAIRVTRRGQTRLQSSSFAAAATKTMLTTPTIEKLGALKKAPIPKYEHTIKPLIYS